jgi:hypothetical protein
MLPAHWKNLDWLQIAAKRSSDAVSPKPSQEKRADEYDDLLSLFQFASCMCYLHSDLLRDLPSPILAPSLCFVALAGRLATIRGAWFILKRHDYCRIDPFHRMAPYGSLLWHSRANQNSFASIQPVTVEIWGSGCLNRQFFSPTGKVAPIHIDSSAPTS